MKKFFSRDILFIGCALFSMFFGAGNIIYPLVVGQLSGDKNIFGVLGLTLTATIIPIAGVIAMILFNGDFRHFFGRLGKIPGLILAATMISLLGPLGSTPRCIALSYTTLKSTFLDVSFILFSLFSCVLIYFLTREKNRILHLLGYVLTPILLISLVTVIIMGLCSTPNIQSFDRSGLDVFVHGLKEGYNTMDLLASFFFSSTILTILKSRIKEEEPNKGYIRTALMASVVGALLLALVYVGFSYLASFHSHSLTTKSDELLSAITMKIAGPYAGILVCITISFACLTTAIALISSFADFFQKEVFKERVSYNTILIASLGVTFFVSTFEFNGIATFLTPILQICYPGLIVLTFLNIAFMLLDVRPIKTPVFAAFATSLVYYFV